MARLSLFLLVGYALPVALLVANLVLGYGGILATIGLFLWIGLAILMAPSEEEG